MTEWEGEAATSTPVVGVIGEGGKEVMGTF